jgi:catechol 2,3-dioxygenase-like lactoylglutathione lyase family enzyme
MFDHVTIRVADRAASEAFYDLVLRTIGISDARRGEHYTEWDDFGLAQADADHPPTHNLHVGFIAPSREHVDDFWRTATDAGYRDDGAPGPRPQYGPDYYGGFLRDPDGNSAEAVHLGGDGHRRHVDHLWIRVGDLAASKRFYELMAPFAGFSLRRERRDRVQFTFPQAHSFSVVASEDPTRHVHVAFPTADNETVDAFHRELTRAGYRDNGPPAERTIYHRGYYAAFVLDPDGNNVEIVNHNR